ncbi:hypothetical protein VTN96DRAFT_6963 [Rasamsonia emersonii]
MIRSFLRVLWVAAFAGPALGDHYWQPLPRAGVRCSFQPRPAAVLPACPEAAAVPSLQTLPVGVPRLPPFCRLAYPRAFRSRPMASRLVRSRQRLHSHNYHIGPHRRPCAPIGRPPVLAHSFLSAQVTSPGCSCALPFPFQHAHPPPARPPSSPQFAYRATRPPPPQEPSRM